MKIINYYKNYYKHIAYPIFWLISIFWPMIFFMVYRSWQVNQAKKALISCSWCFLWPSFSSDLWLLGALLFLLFLSLIFKIKIFQIFFAATGVLIYFVFFADIFVKKLLTHRLHFGDIINYGKESGAQLDILSALFAEWKGMSLFILSCCSIIFFTRACVSSKKIQKFHFDKSMAVFWTGVATISSSVLAWSGGDIYDLNVNDYKNVFLLNKKNTVYKLHSQEYIQNINNSAENTKICKTIDVEQNSFVLVVVESWSLHHSLLFSGLSDITPELDDLAKKGTWFQNYYTNGYSTETALIGLLAGNLPIATHKGWGLLAYDAVDQNAYEKLHAAGYETAFFTTGDLSFSDKGKWLKKIGLSHVEGAEHSAYDGMLRGAFGAASDKALVDRFLFWYDQKIEKESKPFFATLLNVGTHPPFIDADRNDPNGSSEIAAFKRADQEIARLVKGLEDRGFLEKGIVFVVGDHRAMTPRTTQEIALFGESSLSRVPAFALGMTHLPQGRVKSVHQHTDFMPSVLSKVTGMECLSDWQGQIFGPLPSSPKVVIYSHPAIRDELRVYIDGVYHQLKIDGDNTRWLGAPPHNGENLLKQIVKQRLSTDPKL